MAKKRAGKAATSKRKRTRMDKVDEAQTGKKKKNFPKKKKK